MCRIRTSWNILMYVKSLRNLVTYKKPLCSFITQEISWSFLEISDCSEFDWQFHIYDCRFVSCCFVSLIANICWWNRNMKLHSNKQIIFIWDTVGTVSWNLLVALQQWKFLLCKANFYFLSFCCIVFVTFIVKKTAPFLHVCSINNRTNYERSSTVTVAHNSHHFITFLKHAVYCTWYNFPNLIYFKA